MTDEFYSEDEKLKEHFAVIYTPKRQKKTRFPENCVQIVSSVPEALETSNADKGFYPAKVMGPSRSSEGFQIYYLVSWLD